MITLFKAAMRLCGLSQMEAAKFLKIAPRTIQRWLNGSEVPPLRVMAELAQLHGFLMSGATTVSERFDDAADMPNGDFVQAACIDWLERNGKGIWDWNSPSGPTACACAMAFQRTLRVYVARVRAAAEAKQQRPQ